MQTDRTTKTLLFAIALGLWVHVASDWLRPTPVQAQASLTESLRMGQIISSLAAIESNTSSLRSIESNTDAMQSSLSSIALSNSLRR